MSIQVLIKRKWHVSTMEKLLPLLKEIRLLAAQQPGFLSSQTIRNINDHGEILVSSRWESLEAWNAWHSSEKRRNIQARIDSMIGEKTFHELYETINDAGEVIPGQRGA